MYGNIVVRDNVKEKDIVLVPEMPPSCPQQKPVLARTSTLTQKASTMQLRKHRKAEKKSRSKGEERSDEERVPILQM